MQNLPVVFSSLANRQLAEIFDYIAEKSQPDIALYYVQKLHTFCMAIGQHPNIGVEREKRLPGVRFLGYRRRATIAFKVQESSVLIVAIFQGGQDITARLTS
jgi:toxin ParE1/3/4